MADYTQQILKVTVAQLCQTIGWNSIQSTPLELLSDILNKYIKEVAHQTHRYSELYGRTEPNLDDVALAFKDLNVNIADLEEYVTNVDPVPCAIDVPKFPVAKDNHLNFLKPGSKEVVTRPVHVHEYLPPMFPEREDEEKPSDILGANAEPNVEVVSLSGEENEFSKKLDSHEQKHTRPTEAETRYTREITSVMMTTSGFISPAREGKLPDAKAPIIPSNDVEKIPIKEPPSAAVGSLISNSVNGTAIKSEKVKTEKIKPEKIKMKKKSANAAGLGQEKKRKKEKQSMKDNANVPVKLTPMGPPPAKQMPPTASTIYLPEDSPMSAIAEQQKIGKKPFLPKIPKKYKVKDPNKPPKGVLDGKVSKKPKKPPKTPKNFSNMLDELFKVHQPTFPGAMPPNIPVDLNQQRPDVPIDLTDQPNLEQNLSPMTRQLPEQLPQFNPPVNQSPNFMFEGKLSAEPDKRKMNILKRISSKNKEDTGKQSLPLPPHINLPETSIFPIDDMGMSTPPQLSPALPAHLQMTPKKTPRKTPTMSAKKLLKQMASEMPINMTVPKPGENIPFPIGLSPKQLKAAARKQMKALKEPKEKKVRVKKEKVKAKDKKLKEPQWPMHAATDLSMTGPPPMIPPPAVPQRKPDPIPPMLQNIYDQQFTQFANQLRGNMGNLGTLRGADFMQSFPMYPWSGPGLIPANPLFPHFPLQPRQRMPFPLPNFEMFGAFPRLKRPHMEKPEPESMAMPINIELAKCNVAPLVPASLQLEDIPTPPPAMSHQNNYFPPMKGSFSSGNSSSSTTSTPLTHGHQSSKSKPLTPEPKIDNNSTIDLTDDPYDDEPLPPTPPTKRAASPFLATPPMAENTNQMSHVQPLSQSSKQRRLSSSPVRVSSYNADDTQSMTDSFVEDVDSGSNAGNKDKSFKSEKRKDKEHKKEKKDKEGKIKKKKDKKDKTKSKEKSEKRKEKEDKHKDKELKIKTKKEKREKRKEKELARVLCGMSSTPPTPGYLNDVGISSPGSGRDSDSSIVPKLTLKLGTSPRPDTPDSHRKSSMKSVKKDRHNSDMDIDDHSMQLQDSDQSREPSPELARFSALVTRPPKQKTPQQNDSRPYTPSYSRNKRESFNYDSDDESTNILKEDYSALPTSCVLSSPVHLSRPKTPQLQQSKSPVPKQQHAFSSVVSPTVAAFPTDTVVVPSAIETTSRQSSYIDSDGNQVWICPACGRVDDGTPMIGCDGCDAWYHWVCVGIQVPPDANEDWYCRVCIAKKQESQGGDKKKKRKKKDKKDH